MSKLRLLLLGAAISAVLCGCGSATTTPDAAAQRNAVVARYPVVDGSTALHPLGRMAACELLNVKCVWSAPDGANVERTYVPGPDAPKATADQILAMNFNTTHAAYLNLIDGKADVLLEVRAPSSDELAAAQAKGVTLEVTPVALDAFVFLANVDNPVESLPLATIRDIYSGKITTWQQAGVTLPDATSPIHAYQREPDSGSQGLMVSMVMKDTPVIDAPDRIVKTMVGPFNAIGGDSQTGEGGDRLGFGFSVFFYAAVMFDNAHVKIIGVDGVKPTAPAIAGHTYPLADEAYAVTLKGAAADSPGRRYVEWLLSAAGQRAVGLSGYIPLAGG